MSSNQNFQRININLDKKLIEDLDKLTALSTRYKNRTHLIQDILQRYVDMIKIYNQDLK